MLGGLKIKVLMYNAPSGTFTISLKSGATTLHSEDFTSASIKTDLSTSNNYAWIWKAFQFTNPIPLASGVYTLELSSSGYTFSDSSYLGWISDYESDYQRQTDTPSNDGENPQAFQLFEYRDNKLWENVF